LEPYVTTASLVPPEVFYGRSRESSQIKDPYGSCFIYGGRQLGKTALLRSVQAEYNDPERGKIAVYVDLKTEGVGLARPNDYLWEILIREFKRLEVLPSRLPFNAGLDRLVGSLKEWIGASPDRRILLLLDEADNFLESDAKLGLKSGARTEYFGSTSRLKGLMDGTNRRFKVVFAGLHNVQRTTTLSNHPLAHFGEPICIGPLLTDGEWREAKKLIEVPMGSIGYRFASVDSITHILSQTNYYPSLIQLCCQQLLNHMRNIPFDFKTSPPYKVEERHVEDALHNENLRKQLRDRFLWTLQLDPRYEVIAYTIGWLNLSDPLGYGIEGYSVEGLRQQALYFWEKGFQDNTTTDSIRVLLDEMVGLGVLQALPGDRYNLRNQNVLRLMGSEDEIIRNLDRPREAPLLYEPAHLRGVFKRDQEEVFRSPLTVQQESEMLSRQSGTTILFGCNASGLDDVAGYFGQHDAISTEILRGTASRAEFERNLNRFMGLQKNQTLLVIVPETCPWSLDWVGLTLRHTAKMRNEKSFLRFVFLAGPNRTLMICCQEWEEFEILKHNALHTLSLQKWHDSCLRQWLDEEKYMLSVEERGQLIDSTGGWYRPLQMFYSMTKNSPHHWRTGLNQLEEQIRSDKQNQLMEFGISEVTNRARTMLNAMAEYGEAMTVEEIASVGPVSDSIPQVMQSIVWAELLGLVELQSVGHYRLESFVRRLLL
jgi:hypothetical protein